MKDEAWRIYIIHVKIQSKLVIEKQKGNTKQDRNNADLICLCMIRKQFHLVNKCINNN